MVKLSNQFNPDYTVYAGEIIEETFLSHGIKKRQFAKMCGISVKELNSFLKSKSCLTLWSMKLFEQILGIPVHFWSHLAELNSQFVIRTNEKRSAVSE